MGSFVPRLLALTLVWLLATAALTFAAAQRIGTVRPTPTTTTSASSAASAPRVLVVPDVRRQAYVFAKGTLGDAGFAWRVAGSVEGYAANTVVAQTPAAGTRVIDTGAPLVVLNLTRSGKQEGIPEQASSIPATAVKLATLAAIVTPAAPRPVTRTAASVPAQIKTAQAKTALAKTALAKRATAPAPKLPRRRPPAFVVPGVKREPLDEIPLTSRAALLLRWVAARPKPTDANVRHWLYQSAWIVTGAQMGWWHGAAAIRTLITADEHVWKLWGIGALSEADARKALAEVEARSS